VILAELPIAWWTFWLAAAALFFPALIWVLTRLAVHVDAEDGATTGPQESGAAPPGTIGRLAVNRGSAPRLLVAVALAGVALFAVALGASLGAIGSDEREPSRPATTQEPGSDMSIPGMSATVMAELGAVPAPAAGRTFVVVVVAVMTATAAARAITPTAEVTAAVLFLMPPPRASETGRRLVGEWKATSACWSFSLAVRLAGIVAGLRRTVTAMVVAAAAAHTVAAAVHQHHHQRGVDQEH
jgi:hypothetical protein